jgi:hypothetical protein
MTVFNLFSIIFFILSVGSTIIEHHLNDYENMLYRPANFWSFINSLLLIVSLIMLTLTIIQIVPWDHKVF